MYCAWLTIPRTEDDDRWWRWLSVPGSRSVNLRPDNLGTTRASLNFMTDETGLADRSPAEQRADLRERFADVGWEAPRILAALDDADDLYVDDLTQVKCPTWSHGRVVLLGDAAWCVTPIGGFGTSLALIGAYVLAAQLAAARRTTRRSRPTRSGCARSSTTSRTCRPGPRASPTPGPGWASRCSAPAPGSPPPDRPALPWRACRATRARSAPFPTSEDRAAWCAGRSPRATCWCRCGC